MFNPRLFLRMSKWARNPPSKRQLQLIVFVLLTCAILFGIERLFGWPEWLTVNTRRGIMLR